MYSLQGFPDKGSDGMRIEKVSDNQIRCTLTREDLAERQIRLSELAYGTEKAKLLFRDMMQQAAYEFGFEADDIPLMIEAIPLSADTIILVVTKVEYPEELDTRFSKFSEPDPEDVYEDGANGAETAGFEGADDVLGLFRKIQEERRKAEEAEKKEDSGAAAEGSAKKKNTSVNVIVDITKLFVFSDLADVIRLAHVLDGFYTGKNDLYKSAEGHRYYLVISKNRQTPEEFNKVCNILSEYGTPQTCTAATGAFFEEHYQPVVKGTALQTLAQL